MIDRRYAFQVLRAARIYEPAIVKFSGVVYIFEGDRPLARGKTIEEALKKGDFLPVPEGVLEPFVAQGNDVRKGGDHVAIARNRNMALRVANALNAYVPGPSGY